MPSKQQERNALTEIQEIVNVLGPDSYLATAFAGVFNYAKTNIENDFTWGPVEELMIERESHRKTQVLYEGQKEIADRITSSLSDAQEALIERNKAYDQERARARELEEQCHTYNMELAEASAVLEDARRDRDKFELRYEETNEQLIAELDSHEATVAKLHDAELEILRLKAKLYDLMTAGA